MRFLIYFATLELDSHQVESHCQDGFTVVMYWVCFIREQHCVCFLRGGGACACVSKSACAFVVVSVCCHELL